MPGSNDVITVWDDSGKKKLRKYYLTMLLREAHKAHCQTQDNPVPFSIFCNLCPKNVLLLADSPKNQCRCLIHENLFLKLDVMGISYDFYFWTKVLCSTDDISNCWNSKCNDCKNGKKLVPMNLLNAMSTLKQWEKVTVEKENDQDEDESMDNINKKKYVTKYLLQCQRKQVYVREVVELFEASFQENLVHVNTKRIQTKEFQADKSNKNVRVLQMDFGMVYKCMYQDEVRSALWSRGCVNLFMAASISNTQSKTYLISTDSKQKDKNSILIFVEHIYENFLYIDDSNRDVQEVIWTE